MTDDGRIEIKIERGGESITTTIEAGATVQALISDGHLRGVEVVNTRVNGAPAEDDTVLQSGDTVSQIPLSGKQGGY
jgi:molybdopterin converting factor small subunit